MARPMKYDTIEELQDAIDSYFDYIELKERKPTISGLAYELGFTSRQSIYDYANREDEFSYIIKRAVLYMESIIEEMLYSPNTTGSIFWLKNRGWRDKQEIEQTVKGTATLDLMLNRYKE